MKFYDDDEPRKSYPRLIVYKAQNLCQHQDPDLPWRVILRKDPCNYGMIEFKSRTAQSCWDHVAYRLGPKPPKQRLTKTLRQHI
jgi:hypothetical protein